MSIFGHKIPKEKPYFMFTLIKQVYSPLFSTSLKLKLIQGYPNDLIPSVRKFLKLPLTTVMPRKQSIISQCDKTKMTHEICSLPDSFPFYSPTPIFLREKLFPQNCNNWLPVVQVKLQFTQIAQPHKTECNCIMNTTTASPINHKHANHLRRPSSLQVFILALEKIIL